MRLSWKYDENKDYSQYYGKNCVLFLNYGVTNQWGYEIVRQYGTLQYISQPIMYSDNSTECTIGLNKDYPKISIVSSVIEKIYIDITDTAESNFSLIKPFITKKIREKAVIDLVRRFLIPDYIVL